MKRYLASALILSGVLFFTSSVLAVGCVGPTICAPIDGQAACEAKAECTWIGADAGDAGDKPGDAGDKPGDAGDKPADMGNKTGGQTSDRGAYKPLINPITGKTYSGDSYALVTGVVNNVIKATLGLSGVFALIAFIWGGITWMTSYGDTAKVTKGRTMMTWAVIGLIVIFGSFAIVNYLLDALQVGNSAPVSTGGDTTSSGLKGPTQ